MIIKCKSCSRKFVVKDTDIPKEGRAVQCGYCSVTWHQVPISTSVKTIKKSLEIDEESPSVDSIKASDGKTYRFLGSQWAELLPSGKTGLFAKRKISQELDKLTILLDARKSFQVLLLGYEISQTFCLVYDDLFFRLLLD